MGIPLHPEAMLLTLDRAIELARSHEKLPAPWLQRVERLGELAAPRASGKTYIAALGGALLAKATDPTVDSLTQDEAAGPRGYSLRTATEFLTKNNHGRFHLGVERANPLNNRPFIGGPPRIDEFTKIHPRARPAFELFTDCVVEINRMSSEEAICAFASYMRVRMAVADKERIAKKEALALAGSGVSSAVLNAAEVFIAADPEGGKRGQALVAAIMDCFFNEVRLRGINDPGAGDVRVMEGGDIILPVEVKQKSVDEETGLELARDAAMMGADKALLVVLAARHRPLDREFVRRRALDEHGVMVEVCESVRELVGAVAVFGGVRASAMAERLPSAYALRLREHEASEIGQRRWAELMEQRVA
jgi:SacI restriction endonuclease